MRELPKQPMSPGPLVAFFWGVIVFVFGMVCGCVAEGQPRRPAVLHPGEPACSDRAVVKSIEWSIFWPWLPADCDLMDWWFKHGGDFPVEVCRLSDASGNALFDAFGVDYPRAVLVTVPPESTDPLPCTGVPNWTEWPYEYSARFHPSSVNLKTLDLYDVREPSNVITVLDLSQGDEQFWTWIRSSCLSGPPRLYVRRCKMPAPVVMKMRMASLGRIADDADEERVRWALAAELLEWQHYNAVIEETISRRASWGQAIELENWRAKYADVRVMADKKVAAMLDPAEEIAALQRIRDEIAKALTEQTQ